MEDAQLPASFAEFCVQYAGTAMLINVRALSSLMPASSATFFVVSAMLDPLDSSVQASLPVSICLVRSPNVTS